MTNPRLNARRIAAIAVASLTLVALTSTRSVQHASLSTAHGNSISGVLSVEHGDKFDPKTGTMSEGAHYFTLTDASGNRTNLHVSNEAQAEALDGQSITVTGAQSGSNFDAINLSSNNNGNGKHPSPTPTPVPTPTPTPSTGATMVNVPTILFNFGNAKGSQPWTPAQVAALMYGGAPSANDFYVQNSHGKLGITGTVYGWYSISAPTSTCDYTTWTTDAHNAAVAAGANFSGITRFAYMFPYQSSCNWAGLHDGGAPFGNSIYDNGDLYVQVPTHELGHGFGLAHANSLTCTNAAGAVVTFSSTCTSTEYGDPYDVMGDTGASRFDAFHLDAIGFLAPGNIQTVSASGAFTIAPLEANTSATQVLRVPYAFDPVTGAPTQFYWLEYRQSTGTYDSYSTAVTTGVLVHVDPEVGGYTHTQLLNMHPSSSFSNAALLTGETFTDAVHNISIKVSNATATGITVTVTI